MNILQDASIFFKHLSAHTQLFTLLLISSIATGGAHLLPSFIARSTIDLPFLICFVIVKSRGALSLNLAELSLNTPSQHSLLLH